MQKCLKEEETAEVDEELAVLIVIEKSEPSILGSNNVMRNDSLRIGSTSISPLIWFKITIEQWMSLEHIQGVRDNKG